MFSSLFLFCIIFLFTSSNAKIVTGKILTNEEQAHREIRFNNTIYKLTPDVTSNTTGIEHEQNTNWCVIWYLGAFGTLVTFFLIITCTELFYGNPLYRRDHMNAFVNGMYDVEAMKIKAPATPPPPYHLFAPPDYNETVKKIQIYVIPAVHGRS